MLNSIHFHITNIIIYNKLDFYMKLKIIILFNPQHKNINMNHLKSNYFRNHLHIDHYRNSI